MTELISIRRDSPENDHQKLTIELVRLLRDTLEVFIKLNKESYEFNDVMNAISMGSIAFASDSLKLISKDVEDINQLKKHMIDLFMKYMEEIK